MEQKSISLLALRHCAAELLACAICDLYPDTLLVEGESHETGFYYDFVFKRPPDEGLLPQVEERLRALITQDFPIRSLTMMRQNAIELFKHQGQLIKARLLAKSENQFVEVFQLDHFYDSCPLPYIESSKDVPVIKILAVEPALKRYTPVGNLTVTRILGTAFYDKQALKYYLKQLDLAKERDHILLGKQMELFEVEEESGCLWYPKGIILRDLLQSWWKKELIKAGFHFVSTPSFMRSSRLEELMKKNDNVELFPSFEMEGISYCLSPSHVPYHAMLFQRLSPSFADLPLKFAEWEEVFHFVKNPQLSGMLRTRCYWQDKATIFCSEEQVLEELISSLQFISKIIRMFQFRPLWYFSKGVQTKENAIRWKASVDFLANALKTSHFDYKEFKEKNEAKPVIKMCIADSLGREWEIASVGINLSIPKKMGLIYTSKNEGKIPVLIEQSIFGSLERFVGLLVEQYAGNLPLWLMPEQVRIIPLAKAQMEWAITIQRKCKLNGLRAFIEPKTNIGLAEKIEMAERNHVPYLLLLGEQEEREGLVSIRSFKDRKTQVKVTLEEMISKLKEESLTPLES